MLTNISNDRETARALGNVSDSEASKNSQPTSSLTVSSNFEVASFVALCSSLCGLYSFLNLLFSSIMFSF